jgi:serine/threonine protein kinase
MKKSISIPRRLDWANKLWSGLAYLHANFVVHCDIKPANIMVNPDTSEIKIIDYGMAVNLPASRRVKFSRDIVSVWWRPPEIFGMEESIFKTVGPSEYYFGTEVDVYSMGWVILELVAKIEPPKLMDAKLFNLYFWYLAAMGLNPGPGFITNNPPRKFSQKANGINIVLGTIDQNYLSKVISKKASKATINYLTLVARAVTSPPLERPKASDFLVSSETPVISYPRVNISYRGNYSKGCRPKAIRLLQRQLVAYLPEIGALNTDSVLLEAIDLMDRIFSVKEFSNDNFVVGVATTLSLTLTLYSWDGDAYYNSIMEILNFDQREIFFQTYSEIILALNGRLFRPTLDFGGEVTTKDALKIFKEELSPSDIKSYLNST